jgi:hypothetical protein
MGKLNGTWMERIHIRFWSSPMPFAAHLTSWPPYLLLALITAVFIGLAWLGVNLRHRLLSRETMEANREVIAAVFNNTAILYTVPA